LNELTDGAGQGWGEMRPCVQYIGEMRLKTPSCGRISPVRYAYASCGKNSTHDTATHR